MLVLEEKTMRNILFSVLVLLLTDCGANEKSSNTKYIVGVSAFNYADQWASYLFDAIQEVASKYPDVEISISDAKNDTANQISQVEAFVTRKVDAIIIIQVDQAAFGRSAKLAQKDGIPIIAVNRMPLENDFQYMSAFIGIEEKEAGKIQAEKFIEELKAENRLNEEIEVGILMGTLGLANQIARTQGVKEVLANYPNIKITREQTADFNRSLAVPIVENWLQADKTKKLKAIFANNDEMAVGAVISIKPANRNDIKVYGIDAISAAVGLIGNGLNATVEQDPVSMGAQSMEIAYKIIKKEPIEGLSNNKFFWIPLIRIDEKNKDSYLKKLSDRAIK